MSSFDFNFTTLVRRLCSVGDTVLAF